MPSAKDISAEQEKLYESPSLRDDLNDDEATVLLQWGQEQVQRLATDYPEEFEQKCRFLRQLIKGMNRFVGQREFNDAEGQQKYMKKVVLYLETLGFTHVTQEQLFANLPEDPKNMADNLTAILHTLTPPLTTDDGSATLSADESAPDDLI